MPASQSKAPKVSQIIVAIEDPGMEMGRNRNGFHSQIANTHAGYDSIWVMWIG
jgi:hypothetical protein